MAMDREIPCIYYDHMGACKKGRDANHWHYCQHCDKYVPRAKAKHKNIKKAKLYKIRKKENNWE